MHVIWIYHIEVRGRLDAGPFNAASPLEAVVDRSDDSATLLTVCTDQSGLIGLLRHMHGQGLVLLSVSREP